MKPRCRRVETKRGRELARGLGVLAAQRACLHRRWRLSVQRGSERAYDGGNPPDESNWHPVTHRFHYAGLLAVRPLAGASVGTHRFTRTREGSPERGQRTAGHPRGRRDRTAVRRTRGRARGRAGQAREGPTSTLAASCWRPRAPDLSERVPRARAVAAAGLMLARAGLDHLLRGCSRESYWLGRTVV